MSGQLEIRKHLGLEYGNHSFNRFALHDHAILDEKINPQSGVELDAIVDNGKLYLALDTESTFP